MAQNVCYSVTNCDDSDGSDGSGSDDNDNATLPMYNVFD